MNSNINVIKGYSRTLEAIMSLLAGPGLKMNREFH
jgi:hypothetical protein